MYTVQYAVHDPRMSRDREREEMDRMYLPVCRIIIMKLLIQVYYIISFRPISTIHLSLNFIWVCFSSSSSLRRKFVQCVQRHLILLFEEIRMSTSAKLANIHQNNIQEKREMKNNFVNKQNNEQWKVCHVCCLLRDCDAVLCTLSKPWLRKMINKWKSDVQHTHTRSEEARGRERGEKRISISSQCVGVVAGNIKNDLCVYVSECENGYGRTSVCACVCERSW